MSSLEAGIVSIIKLAGAAQNDVSKTTPALEAALTNSTAKGLQAISINPSQGTQLSILCQMLQAKHVLEIGTLGGYSTIWFATSVPGIKFASIEYNPKHRDVALENLKNAGVDNVEVILGPGLDVLPTLADRTFDFVFIDAN
ncbi:Putative class I-like SAM-dependent O-methyltransferase [Septoria linicola]|uniref:Class I-like SAM-dependent O-methyltransferase n=1 Tax=Septoria linicola TaxID=215465 RepID=A0A9Q9B831_9PEZI|nr:Putative class I-like SAM-dependent O-methyltransferase [Septoria linicola]